MHAHLAGVALTFNESPHAITRFSGTWPAAAKDAPHFKVLGLLKTVVVGYCCMYIHYMRGYYYTLTSLVGLRISPSRVPTLVFAALIGIAKRQTTFLERLPKKTSLDGIRSMEEAVVCSKEGKEEGSALCARFVEHDEIMISRFWSCGQWAGGFYSLSFCLFFCFTFAPSRASS